MSKAFESLLVHHCSPVLTGIKVSNLFSCPKSISKEISHYRRFLHSCGMELEPLCCCCKRVLVLAYRPKLLQLHLRSLEQQNYLKNYNYPVTECLEMQIAYLKSRMKAVGEFPHEIGVFLGYPIEDVLGFIENKGHNCKLCGFWKVYGDELKARKLFEQYRLCQKTLSKYFEQGQTIGQILNIV